MTAVLVTNDRIILRETDHVAKTVSHVAGSRTGSNDSCVFVSSSFFLSSCSYYNPARDVVQGLLAAVYD